MKNEIATATATCPQDDAPVTQRTILGRPYLACTSSSCIWIGLDTPTD